MMFSLGTYAQQTTPKPEIPLTIVNHKVTCGDTTQIVNEIKKTFKEVPIGVGTYTDKFLLIIWKGLTNGNYTITLSNEQTNLSCIVLEGSDLKILDEKEKIVEKFSRLY